MKAGDIAIYLAYKRNYVNQDLTRFMSNIIGMYSKENFMNPLENPIPENLIDSQQPPRIGVDVCVIL